MHQPLHTHALPVPTRGPFALTHVTCQDAEVVRKDAYFSTVAAKMKAARERLPSLGPKHAPRSDTSIFVAPPHTEVHALQPDARPEKVGQAFFACVLYERKRCHAFRRRPGIAHSPLRRSSRAAKGSSPCLRLHLPPSPRRRT